MNASFLYIALILCCHSVFIVALVTAEAFNFLHQATTNTVISRRKAHQTYLKKFVPSSARSKSSTQITSVMTNSLEVVLPNWRDVDVHAADNGDDGTVCSPFCHPLSKTSSSASSTAASWSDAALQSGLNLYERIKSCQDPFISSALTSAIHDLEMAYRLYGPFCMVGSYNGGKDAVVIFHLMRAVHAHYCHDLQQKATESNNNGEEGTESSVMIPRPRVIYFNNEDEFPEVLDLLQDTVGLYDLDMLAFKEGVSFGEGLQYLVERNFAPGKNGLSYYGTNKESLLHLPPPHPLAFILGTRSNDPNAGSQNIYAPSSHYMPPFLRVNPILNWNYGQVWHFLRTFELPYCKLYDDGYTSLGTVKDTMPCPALKKDNDEYWPAYMLRDWDQERAGRISKKKKQQQPKEDSEPKNIEQTVTMSQTSSTVSLPNEQEAKTAKDGSSAHTRTMSSELDTDELSSGVVPASSSEHLPSPRPNSVALIVIGDELLKGMTPDSNIISAARALRANNVALARVSIISDDSQEIVEEIQRVTKEVDVVITSGGVGPTHDDVTIKSVAEALGLDMEIHYEMASLLLKKMSNNTEETVQSTTDDDGLLRRMSVGQLKMATLPSKSELKYLTDNPDEWPVLKCDNIFILPGVPTFFEQKIQVLGLYLGKPEEEKQAGLDVDISPSPSQLAKSDTYRIVLSSEEDSIVAALNETVAAHPHVTFGSYPIVDNPEHKTIITLEGRFYNGGYTRSSSRLLDQARINGGDDAGIFFTKQEMDEHLANALEGLKSRLPDESILSIDQGDDLS
eukprot:scaffold10794_cov205-Skeletonema_dohrnii-CCMP3373.AAC.3